MMKKFMKKLWEKKDSKKGFTLVELIVVLVILAILAAIMVPALIGWIDKAKEKQAAVEARTVYLAAQTIASEKYAKSGTWSTNWGGSTLSVVDGDSTGVEGEIITLAGLTNATFKAEITASNGVVTKLVYTPDDKKIIPIIIGQ